MNRRWFLGAGVLGLAVVAVASGTVLDHLLDIRRSAPAATASVAASRDPRPTVGIGVVSRFPPNLIFAGYQPLIDYLNDGGAFHYVLRPSSDYLDAADRLRRGEVAASFLGAWMLRRLGPEGGLVPLLQPAGRRGPQPLPRRAGGAGGLGHRRGRRPGGAAGGRAVAGLVGRQLAAGPGPARGGPGPGRPGHDLPLRPPPDGGVAGAAPGVRRGRGEGGGGRPLPQRGSARGGGLGADPGPAAGGAGRRPGRGGPGDPRPAAGPGPQRPRRRPPPGRLDPRVRVGLRRGRLVGLRGRRPGRRRRGDPARPAAGQPAHPHPRRPWA